MFIILCYLHFYFSFESKNEIWLCLHLLGNQVELSALLRYHLGEGLLVSGGMSSHTLVRPLQGEKLELAVVGHSAHRGKNCI